MSHAAGWGLTRPPQMVGGSRCCYPRLSFSGDDAIAKYFSKEWWDSRSPEQKAVFNVAALIPAARAGSIIWKGAQGVRVVRGASTAVSVSKRPVHEAAVRLATWPSHNPNLHGPLHAGLIIRKKLGMVALGYSAINPFQSINYARKKDWHRLFWNLRYPIVGVPLYNLYSDQNSKGSGSPPSASPTEPKPFTSALPDRTTASQRRASKEGREWNRRYG